MHSERPLKFFGAFLAALLVYAVLFTLIQRLRDHKGPWEVTFSATNQAGSVEIYQPRLGISNVVLRFTGAGELTNPAARVKIRFDQARPVPFDLPFGTCIFLDTTFLPGTVTMRIFGHEIELLPRVLILNHAEHPWRSGEHIQLSVRTSR